MLNSLRLKICEFRETFVFLITFLFRCVLFAHNPNALMEVSYSKIFPYDSPSDMFSSTEGNLLLRYLLTRSLSLVNLL